MSGEKGGDIAVAVVGGAVVLTAGLVGGAAVLAGKGVVGTVRGAATIIGDANRGRKVRKGLDVSRQNSDKLQQDLEKKIQRRDQAYEQKMAGLKKEQKDMLQSFSRQTKEQRKQYENKLSELRVKQRRYIDKRCNTLEDNLQQVEQNFNNRMEEMTHQVNEQFATERSRIDNMFQQERAAVQQAMETQRTVLQSQINNLQAHIDNSRDAAAGWLDVLEAEVGFIRDNYRHQFFCPRELANIEERLALSQKNLKTNIYEVSITQEAFIQARILRDRLEYLEQEWENNRILALELVDAAINTYDACKDFEMTPVEMLDDQEDIVAPADSSDMIQVDTDEWTDGQWNAEYQKLQALKQQVSGNGISASLRELQSIQNDADTAIARSSVLTVKAKCAVIASSLRAEMQFKIFEKLQKAGYELVGNEWENDDWRKANHMVLQGMNGEKIAISITPRTEGAQTINRINLAFHEPNCNEEMRQVKLDTIKAALSEAYDIPDEQLHFELTPGSSWNANAPVEKFDLQRLKKQAKQAS